MNGLGPDQIDFTVDTKNLFREEGYTDLQVASIRKLVPVKTDGTDDDTREPVFVAHTQLMSNAGPLPVQCPLEAKTLEDAIKEFPGAIKETIDNIVNEVQKQQADASRIVVPGGNRDSNIIM